MPVSPDSSRLVKGLPELSVEVVAQLPEELRLAMSTMARQLPYTIEQLNIGTMGAQAAEWLRQLFGVPQLATAEPVAAGLTRDTITAQRERGEAAQLTVETLQQVWRLGAQIVHFFWERTVELDQQIREHHQAKRQVNETAAGEPLMHGQIGRELGRVDDELGRLENERRQLARFMIPALSWAADVEYLTALALRVSLNRIEVNPLNPNNAIPVGTINEVPAAA
ncbi:MAG: hypothetical protein COU69_04120 [Candidatus Pacebacteria bacterium CG10_big_fil_rev_8_21_14_0_10_56_10]|nr:MAG: hypothetical protein COU69_04120 [Candidatus Pacebacteria bacterium CG10_big_fil_rev_8_21_14_0_10_56_10]